MDIKRKSQSTPTRQANGKSAGNPSSPVGDTPTKDPSWQKELFFQSTFETSPAPMLLVDPKSGRVFAANTAACEFYGYSAEAFSALCLWDLNMLSQAETRQRLAQAIATKRIRFDVKHRLASGEIRDVHVYSGLAQLDGRDLLQAVIFDISDRKRAEAALRESQQTLQSILDNTSLLVYVKDLEGRLTLVNRQFESLFSAPREQLLGKSSHDLMLGKDADAHRANDLAVAAKRDTVVVEERNEEADGTHTYLSTKFPLFDLAGEMTGICGISTDITERKRAEEALQESSRRLELAFRAGRMAVWDWDLQSNTMVWDDAMLGLYGLSREQFSGGIEAWKQCLHPEDRERALADCQAALDGTREFDTEFRVLQPGRRIRHIKANGLVLRDEGGAALRMLGLNQDVTERRQAEKNYEMLFREMLDGFALHEIICDAENHPMDYRFLAVNPAFERMTGLKADTILGRTVQEVLPGTEQHWIETYGRVALTGEPTVFENYALPLKKHFEVKAFRSAPGQFACIFADITESKKAEEEKAKLEAQLHQAQKMESVGRLAGGVAHDFNNMLGVILGHVELAMEQLDPAQPIHVNLEEIQKAARRSSDLTRQLLAFARKQTIAPKVLDLNQTIEGMLKMLRRLIGEDINLSWKPNVALWPVNLDPSQIDQILVNLCVNARDAIGNVGKLTIETDNCTFDQDHCAGHAGYMEGEYVQISVSDNGRGMDRETLAQIFEPFFTTKGVGKGTGLGLATIYGIVKQNNGFINVYSEPGQGTTFKICLPRHGGEARRGSESAVGEMEGGHEIILLVEDEQSILEMTKTILERRGYSVVAAKTPGEAIQVAREHPTEIHLLISDVVMPEMNGRELAKNLLSLCPRMKRLFMSGYTANVIAHHGVLDKGVNFIQKPFSGKDLAAKVREALDG